MTFFFYHIYIGVMLPPSPHEQTVSRYFAEQTEKFYIKWWDPNDLHFGLYEPGESIAFYNILPERRAVQQAGIRRMTEAIVAPAQITANDRVLDAGCGVGGTALYVAQTRGCQVLGVNICEPQLETARAKAAEAGLSDQVRFAYGDCSQALPADDHSIDVIINIESACHYSNRAQFLAECARVLKPGGRMVGQDWVAHDHTSPEDYQQFIQPLCDAWYLHRLETPASYQRLLTQHGLTVREAVDLGDGIRENMRYMRFASEQAEVTAAKTGQPLDPDMMLWMRQFKTISDAWFAGHFTQFRYVAHRA